MVFIFHYVLQRNEILLFYLCAGYCNTCWMIYIVKYAFQLIVERDFYCPVYYRTIKNSIQVKLNFPVENSTIQNPIQAKVIGRFVREFTLERANIKARYALKINLYGDDSKQVHGEVTDIDFKFLFVLQLILHFH